MGEPQTPHFKKIRIFGSVQTTQNQLFLSLETPGCPRQIQKIPGTFLKTIIFITLKMLGIQIFEIVGKDGRQNIPPIRLIKSWKSWMWDQDLPENMKWNGNKLSLLIHCILRNLGCLQMSSLWHPCFMQKYFINAIPSQTCLGIYYLGKSRDLKDENL